MKKIIFLVVILLIIVAKASQAKPKPKNELSIISVKRHTVYFKVNKSFIGGLIEIYDKDKNCLEADSIPHTHSMIYFDEFPAGHYTIKVKKGKKSTQFEYINI
jgi:hypothetical protein